MIRITVFLCLTILASGCRHQIIDPRDSIAHEILLPQRYAELVQHLGEEIYPTNLNGKLRGFTEQEVLQAMWINHQDEVPALTVSFAQSPEISAEILDVELRKGCAHTRRTFAAAVTGGNSVPVYAESFKRRPMDGTWRAIPPWRKLR